MTTTNIVSAFEVNNEVKVDSCTILVRYLESGHPLISGKHEAYAIELDSRIARWKEMVKQGRIRHLKIIGCPNIPDSCYLIIDQSSAHVYVNKIDYNDPCNQAVEKEPFSIYHATEDQEKISCLVAQFDSYVEYFKNHGTILVNTDK